MKVVHRIALQNVVIVDEAKLVAFVNQTYTTFESSYPQTVTAILKDIVYLVAAKRIGIILVVQIMAQTTIRVQAIQTVALGAYPESVTTVFKKAIDADGECLWGGM